MKPQVFNIGDIVWLLGHNLKTWQPNKKLDFKFMSSFKVKDRVRTQVSGCSAVQVGYSCTEPKDYYISATAEISRTRDI